VIGNPDFVFFPLEVSPGPKLEGLSSSEAGCGSLPAEVLPPQPQFSPLQADNKPSPLPLPPPAGFALCRGPPAQQEQQMNPPGALLLGL